MSTTTKPAPLDFLGSPARVYASEGALGLVHVEHRPGEMPPLHVHHAEDEGFYVLEGSLTIYLPGESVELGAGDFYLAPRGVPHTFEAGPEGSSTLVQSVPGGFRIFTPAIAHPDIPQFRREIGAFAKNGVAIDAGVSLPNALAMHNRGCQRRNVRRIVQSVKMALRR